MKKVIFISSTGGHLTELLQLSPLFSKYESYLITEDTNANQSLGKEYPGVTVRYLKYGTRSHLFSYVFKFLYNCILSLIYYIQIKPDVVISTGTHTAVPLCKIAHWRKKKVIWIETFANVKTPTKAGLMVYKDADLFLVQWESMKEVYPQATYKGWIF